jgi:tetratricopeptide (TPR) repeat protein
MRRRCLALATAVLVLSADASSAQKIRTIRGFEQFQTWARLVQAHVPGSLDDAARTIAAWPLADLQSTVTDLEALATMLKRRVPVIRYPEPVRAGAKPTGRQREISLNQVPAMLMLADDEFGLALDGTELENAFRRFEREVTHVMKLAAMLHADIAILAPPRDDAGPIVPDWPAPDPANVASRGVVKVRDGQAVGLDDAPVHWALGCLALDMVTPEPAADKFVQQWYRATSSYQLSRRSYGYAAPLLAHARVVLPRDPHIQFYSGVLQEDVAAPPVQVAVQSLEGSAGYRFNVLPVPRQLQQADVYLRRALELDGSLHEARVRRARVVGLLGRHDEAAAELRRAMPALTSDGVRYYAELFLGGDEQALGHIEAARAAFERAHALFPLAQSPLLALSQLEWQGADRAAALAAFRELAALPGPEIARQDPWWTYDVSPFMDTDLLLTGLRAAALKEKDQ